MRNNTHPLVDHVVNGVGISMCALSKEWLSKHESYSEAWHDAEFDYLILYVTYRAQPEDLRDLVMTAIEDTYNAGPRDPEFEELLRVVKDTPTSAAGPLTLLAARIYAKAAGDRKNVYVALSSLCEVLIESDTRERAYGFMEILDGHLTWDSSCLPDYLLDNEATADWVRDHFGESLLPDEVAL